MEKKQINKLRMFRAVDQVLDNQSQIFAELEDLVLGHQRLKDGLVILGQNRQVQEADNSGLTDNKTDLRLNLVNRILQLSTALKAHANSSKNKELKAKVSYTRSDLLTSPDPVLYDIGTLMVNLATPILSDLNKYFVSNDKMDELNGLLADFIAAIPQKRVANSVSKVSTVNIAEVVNSLITLLREDVDVLMQLFEETQPDFYKAYKNARIIVDYSGGGPSKDTVTGTDKPIG
jgi:hypothetical protein